MITITATVTTTTTTATATATATTTTTTTTTTGSKRTCNPVKSAVTRHRQVALVETRLALKIQD
ncbi:hypothetical protein ACFW04_004560 [Cataglyphis niger]